MKLINPSLREIQEALSFNDNTGNLYRIINSDGSEFCFVTGHQTVVYFRPFHFPGKGDMFEGICETMTGKVSFVGDRKVGTKCRLGFKGINIKTLMGDDYYISEISVVQPLEKCDEY